MPNALRAMLSMVAMNRHIARSFAPIRNMARGTGRLIGGVFRGAYLALGYFLNRMHNIPRHLARSGSSFGRFFLTLRRIARFASPFVSIFRAVTRTARPIKEMTSQMLSLQNILSAMALSDQYMNSLARINAVNDGTRSDTELQEKIYAAAYRSRGSFFEITDYVARLGLTAPEAFSGNDEVIAFTELAQKAFRLGGADATERQEGMNQLIGAMATGGFQGDDFVSIMNTAPLLAKAISDFTGKSMDQLKAMSAEGMITADIIKWALFNAADDINREFEDLPLTFGDIGKQLSSVSIRSFGPVIERVSQFVNSDEGQQLITGISQAIQMAATYVGMLIDGIEMVASFIINNWSVIEPILWGVVAAIGAWTIAQWLLNFALSFNPIGLIIMAIGVLIGLITVLIMWIVDLWRNNDEFVAGLYRTWNSVLNFFDRIPIFFARVAVGIRTAFFNARAESLRILEGLVNGAINQINWLIEQLNRIPGVSIDALQHVEFAAESAAEAEAVRQAGEESIRQMEAEAARRATEREQKVRDFLADRAAKRALEEAEKKAKEEQEVDYSKWQADPPTWPTDHANIDKVNEVGRINDTVDISSEDLKMMRELAEMNAIQNFVSLTPTVNVQTGDIRNGYDVDTIISRIEQSLTDQIASSAQGVYGLG